MFPFADDRLYRVDGGNFQLAVELLKYAAAELHETRVTAVERRSDGRWRLLLAPGATSTCAAGQVRWQTYLRDHHKHLEATVRDGSSHCMQRYIFYSKG